MEPVSFLVGLVDRYSPSGSERTVAEYASGCLREAGLDAHVDPAGNVCAEIGTGDCALLFLGHIDTVDGDRGVRVADGCVHGRGAVDAKGPFAAFAAALVRLAAVPGRRVVLVGAVEEETLSSNGARYIVDRYRPECAIIGEPSGWQGLTLGYKGRLALRYRGVSVPEHGAAPGPSPLQRAVDYWNALCAYRDAYNADKSVFYQLDLSLQDIRQSATPERTEVELIGHARLPIGLDPDELKAQAIAAGDGATVEPVDDAPPILAGKNNPLVRAFLRAIRRHGGQPAFKVKTGTSDMNIVGPAWGVPILAYGPGDSSLDHTPFEFLRIDEYLRSIDILTDVVAALSDRLPVGSDRVQSGEG
ncbi:MAG TPA: M20/M25/M40 family metallo-hydrolase [Micromonosporaceae bacterium]|nr:M20/M25/M40 family metallo-hydrolase [Micromonosporaceae bacterium]